MEVGILKVKIKKLCPEAVTPTYATDGSGCFDIYAASLDIAAPNAIFRTGLAFEVPEGHVMLVFSRSGHGFSQGVRLSNCVGVIDADYRGEMAVSLHKDTPGVFTVHPKERIAQALIVPVERVEFEEVDELSPTGRGMNGFGSSGR